MYIRNPVGWARAAILAFGALAAAASASQAAEAADYPAKPVRIVVGYSPGGATDVLARLVATELSAELGQPFIVENRPGAGSNIATEAVVRAQPDGYTLLVLTIQNATNMSVYKNIGYDTNKDLQPIAQFMASPSVLVVSPALPVDSLASLIAAAKADPRALSYASTGVGGSPHLAGEMLKWRAGIDMLHVPYKGTAPAMTDVIAGNVSASFMTTLGVLEQMQTGKMRPLAVAYGSRLPELPDVPTMAEAGLADFEVTSWNGLAAPAGTPPDVVEKLAAAVDRILQKPAMQERIRGLGGQAVLRGPQAFAAHVQAETEKWRKVVEAAHISMD
ncbi:tripartite tricarboxylate transporter substrate binding protein [Bordetella sp. 2513F-2]